MKSLWCEHEAASLSREGVRVSYFAEENPIGEELRRLAKLQPDPAHFRLFHRTGMDLTDERWVVALLGATRGDDIIFLDSWTDLWGGNEDANREVQQFDAAVLKPLQRQGVTPVVIHHMGHRYMFSDRGGATGGRGASSLGQKADVTLEFKSAGDDLFTIVYGKCRIGGIHQPPRSFKVEDTDDGRVRDRRVRVARGPRRRGAGREGGAGDIDGAARLPHHQRAARRRGRRQEPPSGRLGHPRRRRTSVYGRREGAGGGRQVAGLQSMAPRGALGVALES